MNLVKGVSPAVEMGGESGSISSLDKFAPAQEARISPWNHDIISRALIGRNANISFILTAWEIFVCVNSKLFIIL